MKALTLWQPYASLMIGGFKTYETRSWCTEYRGWLAIHAAKKEPSYVFDMLNPYLENVITDGELFWQCLDRMGYHLWKQLPRGAVIGLIEINAVYRTEAIRDEVGPYDKAFGDWRDGRFAWHVKGIIPYTKPVPAKGKQRLWEWNPPDWVIEEMRQ